MKGVISIYKRFFKTALGFLIIFFSLDDLVAQNQPLADSLIKVLENEELDTTEHLRMLRRICVSTVSPKEKIFYAEKLYDLATQKKDSFYIVHSYISMGIGLRYKGDLQGSLNYLLQASKISIKRGNVKNLAECYAEISTTYTANDDNINALKYNTKAIQMLRKTDAKDQLALTLLNTGYDYYSAEKYDTALLYYNESEPILSTFEVLLPLAYLIGNRALVKWKLGEVDEAVSDLNQAIGILKTYGDNYAIADYFNQLGNISLQQDSLEKAIFNLTSGVRLAQEEDLKEQVRDASKLLSEIYDELGESDSAYHYLNQYLAMRDSIQNEEVTLELANQRADFEIGLKEDELKQLEIKRRNQLIMAVSISSVLLVIGFVGYRYQQARSRRKLEKQVINQRLAELKALKAQINPHFLFNALNSIQSYILEDQHEVAESYLVKYGKLMRKILNHSNELTTLLKDALELLELYVELEQIRIDGGFKYKVSIDDSIDDSYVKIPAMIIQPFIENAIWHGIADSKGKGVIKLSIHPAGELIEIIIEDNGKGFDTSKTSNKSSKGVHLVRERLELLKDSEGSESAIEISSEIGKGTKVSLRFPSDLT